MGNVVRNSNMEGDEMNKAKYTRIRNELSIQKVWEARKRISPLIHRTPLLYSFVLSEQIGRPVYLKLETVHDIGAFKVRGAANKILSLSDEEKRSGVATFSTGNHGMAVAYIAQKLGIEATVCISNRVPKAKVDSLKRLGAKIERIGESQDQAGEYCYQLEREKGVVVIPPFDDPDIIAGQGTIGLEIIEEAPDVTDIIVPLSGGGLLAGIGLAVKSLNPNIKVTGVSMEKAAVMFESIKAGKPIQMKEEPTLADSLLGGIGLDNQYTFDMVTRYMDQGFQLTEDEIAYSMAFMMDHHRLIIEGAAATGVATIIGQKLPQSGGAVAVIISGNNVDLSVLLKIMDVYQLNR